jgi:hypothetical protein
VRAHSPDARDARIRVAIQSGTKQRDGSVAWRELASSYASEVKDGDLAAELTGAEEMKVQVSCEDPRSLTVLATASLT